MEKVDKEKSQLSSAEENANPTLQINDVIYVFNTGVNALPVDNKVKKKMKKAVILNTSFAEPSPSMQPSITVTPARRLLKARRRLPVRVRSENLTSSPDAAVNWRCFCCNDCQHLNCGSVVWAKGQVETWWPGIIDYDPDESQFCRINDNRMKEYHVIFLDDKLNWRNWVSVDRVKPFSSFDETLERIKSFHYLRIENAKKQAIRAIQMSIEGRLQRFGYDTVLCFSRRPLRLSFDSNSIESNLKRQKTSSTS